MRQYTPLPSVRKYLLAVAMLCPLAALAEPPMVVGPLSFTEVGNDVQTQFSLRDYARFSSLADDELCCVKITLWEDDIIFDDLLGSQTITLRKSDLSPIFSGGFESHPINLTFLNASNSYTGWGSDYYLTADFIPCVPEPDTAALMIGGLALVSQIKRKRKES